MNVCLSVGWSVCLLVMCEGECKGRPASCESIKSFVIRHRRDGGAVGLCIVSKQGAAAMAKSLAFRSLSEVPPMQAQCPKHPVSSA